LLEYVDKLEDEIEILKLRLDYKAYQVFRESLNYNVGVSQPFESIIGFDELETELRTKIGSSIDPSRTDLRQKARFCLDFVADAILRWESVERASWFDLLIQMSQNSLKPPAPAVESKGGRQKLIPLDELEKYLEEGWRCEHVIEGMGRAVVSLAEGEVRA
jgi:hypothetical protein